MISSKLPSVYKYFRIHINIKTFYPYSDNFLKERQFEHVESYEVTEKRHLLYASLTP